MTQLGSIKLACRLVLALALPFGAGTALAQVALVVSPSSSVVSADAKDLANLFLGKTGMLQGAAAVPVDQAESAAVREELYAKLAGKSPAQVKANWSRLAVSGRGLPPRQFDTSDDVKKYIAEHPNAIGYIETAAVDSSVKVVLTLN
jgi:ABC-type phosphate transport system substrate-binding protein